MFTFLIAASLKSIELTPLMNLIHNVKYLFSALEDRESMLEKLNRSLSFFPVRFRSILPNYQGLNI